MERGIVKSRVAFVLRSSEIKLPFDRFVTLWTSHFFKNPFGSLCTPWTCCETNIVEFRTSGPPQITPLQKDPSHRYTNVVFKDTLF